VTTLSGETCQSAIGFPQKRYAGRASVRASGEPAVTHVLRRTAMIRSSKPTRSLSSRLYGPRSLRIFLSTGPSDPSASRLSLAPLARFRMTRRLGGHVWGEGPRTTGGEPRGRLSLSGIGAEKLFIGDGRSTPGGLARLGRSLRLVKRKPRCARIWFFRTGWMIVFF